MRTKTETTNGITRKAGAALWTFQVLLALLFLFAGGMKLILPLAALTEQSPLPGLFLRFIGVAEVAGALGLVLPGLLRIRRGLTPLAATGLTLIMTGAVGVTMGIGQVGPALFPGVVGLVSALVAWRHWRRGAAQPSGQAQLQAA